MTRPRLAAFISPHGFGHAARACAVLTALGARFPELEVELWTSVPRWFFAESLAQPFALHELATDVGLVQRSAIAEDLPATVARLAAFWPPDPELVRQLADGLRARGCRLVLADISPLGLAVAHAAGLPSALVENFTWSWIYEGLLDRASALAPFVAAFRAEVDRATLRFRAAPACGDESGLAVGPIARAPRQSPTAVRARLGLSGDLPLVLVSMGGIPWQFGALDAWSRRDDLALVVPGGATAERRRGSLVLLPHHSPVWHPDLVAAADVVVGKLGYSTVAEAVRAGTRYAFVPRPGFRETAVLEAYVRAHLPALALAPEELADGSFLSRLATLLAAPRPAPLLVDGAAEVAAGVLPFLVEG